MVSAAYGDPLFFFVEPHSPAFTLWNFLRLDLPLRGAPRSSLWGAAGDFCMGMFERDLGDTAVQPRRATCSSLACTAAGERSYGLHR